MRALILSRSHTSYPGMILESSLESTAGYNDQSRTSMTETLTVKTLIKALNPLPLPYIQVSPILAR